MKKHDDKKPLLVRIGINIRSLRESKTELSQEAFAQSIGMNRTYQSSVERGERNISAINLAKIAYALNSNISSLFPAKEELRQLVEDELL